MNDAIRRLYLEYNNPAPRNRTLFLTEADRTRYADFPRVDQLQVDRPLSALLGRVYLGDCVKGMSLLPDETVDLVFADPPYNLGKDFGNSQMRLSDEEYEEWSDRWIRQAVRLLKPTGSIYVCTDWRRSGVIHVLLDSYLTVKNRITWRREKGRGSGRNWKNNMEDVWFAVKSDNYIFNIAEVKIKKEVIAPYRENGQPKDWVEENGERYRYTYPPNIWIDTVVPFWSMPENTPHPTQKPEMVVERVMKASSNPGDVVLDPFMGSGTTAVVAMRLARRFIGFETNEEYIRLSMKRLQRAQPGLL
ncbi:MAG: site-specific DNA-methyltransferase [Chloroflexi bacterium B3_Chlor]|nr:MAG: site-specific DNA-methyltransferase [Chloroflexi bacterium B3_Chlor]